MWKWPKKLRDWVVYINSKIWFEKIILTSDYKMDSYCLKCKKYTENIDPQVSSTSNGKLMIISKCKICNSKKSQFINKQEAKGSLSKLGIKTPLNKIPILSDVLFWKITHYKNWMK